MVKLLYLLAGIALKQAVDEIKAVTTEYVENLKKDREVVATYRPNPAILAGSPEAHRVVAQAQHAAMVAPEVRRLSRKILIVRLLPLAAYVLATIGLVVWIAILETSGAGTP